MAGVHMAKPPDASSRVSAPLDRDTLFLASVLVFLLGVGVMGGVMVRTPPHPDYVAEGPITLGEGSSVFPRGTSNRFISRAVRPVTFFKTTLRDDEGLSLVAAQHGLKLGTLFNVNKVSDASVVRPGFVYVIPDRDGVSYRPSARDSIASIADKFGVSAEKIAAANNLKKFEEPPPRATLFIPDAIMRADRVERILGDYFVYPAGGIVRARFGESIDPFLDMKRINDGIDIEVMENEPVRASADGAVSDVGFRPAYGFYVVVSHRDGMATFYGSLAGPLSMSKGERVKRGSTIGRAAPVDRAHAVKIHFSMFKNGKSVDPIPYLK